MSVENLFIYHRNRNAYGEMTVQILFGLVHVLPFACQVFLLKLCGFLWATSLQVSRKIHGARREGQGEVCGDVEAVEASVMTQGLCQGADLGQPNSQLSTSEVSGEPESCSIYVRFWIPRGKFHGGNGFEQNEKQSVWSCFISQYGFLSFD